MNCSPIRVCLFCLSTEFGVDESALFVRLRGVFNFTPITLSESKKVTISSLIFVQQQIECVDAYELFTKQGNVLKSLFDNTDSPGVHISVEGCTKIRDEIVTFFDSDKVIGVKLKTPRKS
jgi:hypothetical protein